MSLGLTLAYFLGPAPGWHSTLWAGSLASTVTLNQTVRMRSPKAHLLASLSVPTTC
jgi:hypothetical protein